MMASVRARAQPSALEGLHVRRAVRPIKLKSAARARSVAPIPPYLSHSARSTDFPAVAAMSTSGTMRVQVGPYDFSAVLRINSETVPLRAWGQPLMSKASVPPTVAPVGFEAGASYEREACSRNRRRREKAEAERCGSEGGDMRVCGVHAAAACIREGFLRSASEQVRQGEGAQNKSPGGEGDNEVRMCSESDIAELARLLFRIPRSLSSKRVRNTISP